MVERFNRTMAEKLAKHCEASQQDWDVWLPYLLMAYRSAEHEVTGYTAARLMFGREMRLPVDLTTGRPPSESLPTVETDYARALQRRMEGTRKKVSDSIRLAGQSMWRRYQQRVRDASYRPGERVWLHNPRRKRGLSPKLQSPWEGPYTVVEALSDVTYRISPGVGKRRRVVHVDRLARYPEKGTFMWGVLGEGEAPEASDAVITSEPPAAAVAAPENATGDDGGAGGDVEYVSGRSGPGDENSVGGEDSAGDENDASECVGEDTLMSVESRRPEPSVRPKRSRHPPVWAGDYYWGDGSEGE